MPPAPKPKVITHEETHRRPVWRFSEGLIGYVRISTEIEGSQNAVTGWGEHEPDMEPLRWHQANWDEHFFCAKGSLKVIAEDKNGKKMELNAKLGESIFLPAGYIYTLMPTGEPSVNLWTVAPVARRGIAAMKDVFPTATEIGKKLKEMAKEKIKEPAE